MILHNLTSEDLENNLQKGKNIFLEVMAKNGDISEEVFKKYSNDYAILLKKPSFFIKLFKNKVDDDLSFIVVEQKSITY